MKAALQLYLRFLPHPSLPLPSLFSSSVDHGTLISICFTVISHNSSVAAEVPAFWARLPPMLAPALAVCQPGNRLAALWRSAHSVGLVGFSVGSVQTLRCYKSASQSLRRSPCPPSPSRGFCHFLHIPFALKLMLH